MFSNRERQQKKPVLQNMLFFRFRSRASSNDGGAKKKRDTGRARNVSRKRFDNSQWTKIVETEKKKKTSGKIRGRNRTRVCRCVGNIVVLSHWKCPVKSRLIDDRALKGRRTRTVGMYNDMNIPTATWHHVCISVHAFYTYIYCLHTWPLARKSDGHNRCYVLRYYYYAAFYPIK